MQWLKQVMLDQKQENDGAQPPSPEKLITYLMNNLPGYEPGRGFATIHASAVTNEETKFCPREVALLDVTKKKVKDQYVSIASAVAFYQGDSLANAARRVWFRKIAVGNWRCEHCEFESEELSKYPGACPHCNGTKWAYVEVRFTSDQTGVSGGIDLLLDLGQPKYKLVEIKTMDKDQFKALKGPLSEHRIRTSFYQFLVRDDSKSLHKDKIDTDAAVVLYISKGYGAKNDDHDGKIMPFKEFPVPYDPDCIQPAAYAAQKVKFFREGKSGVPQGVCPTSFVPRVKQCSCAKECWSAKFPPQAGEYVPINLKP